MNEEEHELKYLLCAKFHDDDFDDRGYVTRDHDPDIGDDAEDAAGTASRAR